MFTFLKQRGFANFPIITGFSLCVPVALVQPRTVKRSFDFLKPGADFSQHDTSVLSGKHFLRGPVSLALYICLAVKPFSSIT